MGPRSYLASILGRIATALLACALSVAAPAAWASWCASMSCPSCAAHGYNGAGRECFSSQQQCQDAVARAQANTPGATYSACTNDSAPASTSASPAAAMPGKMLQLLQQAQEATARQEQESARVRDQAQVFNRQEQARVQSEEQARALERQSLDARAAAKRQDLLANLDTGANDAGLAIPQAEETCPPGTTQVGTREPDATGAVHPLCSRPSDPRKPGPGWRAGLDCAMKEIDAQARDLGPEAVQFSNQLRQQLAQLRSATDQPSAGAKFNDTSIANVDLDRQVALHRNGHSQDEQFIVQVMVAQHGGGGVSIDVRSALAAPGKPSQGEHQSTMIFDASGHLASIDGDDGKPEEMAQVSAAVRKCIGP